MVAAWLASTAQASEWVLTGQVCIAPLPTGAREVDHDYPDGRAPREYSYDFTVLIDSEDPVHLSETESILVPNFFPFEKHLVFIRDGDNIIESFWFRFDKRGSHHLCLTYQPWYQTWSLDPPREGNKACDCWKESD